MRLPVLLAFLLVTGPALAGCIGSGEEDQLSSTETLSQPNSTAEVTEVTEVDADAGSVDESSSPVTLPVEVPLEASRSFEGTFQAHEACVPAGCVAGMATGSVAHQRVHPIGDLVPHGVLVEVNVTLTDDVDSGARAAAGDPWMWLRTPAGQVTEIQEERISTEVLQRAPGAAAIVVENPISEPDQPSVSYQLEVRTRVQPDRVPAGVPVGIDVPGDGSGAKLTTEAGEEILYSLWGPDGGFAGRFASETGAARIPADQLGSGESVLLVHRPHDDPVRLHLPEGEPEADGQPAARVLPTELVEGEPQQPGDDGTASWSFSTERAPAAVGLSIEMGQTSWKDGIGGLVEREDSRVEIAGPEGTVLSSSDVFYSNCVVCYPPETYTFQSTPGHSGLLPGSYDVSVEGVYGGETTLTHRIVTFER